MVARALFRQYLSMAVNGRVSPNTKPVNQHLTLPQFLVETLQLLQYLGLRMVLQVAYRMERIEDPATTRAILHRPTQLVVQVMARPSLTGKGERL